MASSRLCIFLIVQTFLGVSILFAANMVCSRAGKSIPRAVAAPRYDTTEVETSILTTRTKSEAGSRSSNEEYLLTKWKESAAEVKRLIIALRNRETGETPPRKYHPDFQTISSQECSREFMSVATLNIFNVNEPWRLRKEGIVNLLIQMGVEVVGLQEVRIFNGENQAQEIIDLLKTKGQQWYFIYDKVQEESRGREEGLAILSRYPIIERSYYPLIPSDPSLKTRALQLATVVVPEMGNVSVGNTHFGIEDVEQCFTVASALRHLDSHFDHKSPQIFLGDFNAYFDFEWPMDLLTQRGIPTDSADSHFYPPINSCLEKFKSNGGPALLAEGASANSRIFRDVWEQIYPPEEIRLKNLVLDPNIVGLTFPNVASRDLQDFSRPDRILVRGPVHACNVCLFGDTPLNPTDGEKMAPIFISDHKGVLARLTRDAG